MRGAGPGIERAEIIPHRDHAALLEAVMLVERPGTVFEFVGQQRDAQEILGPGITEGVREQAASVTLAAVILVHHEILENQDESPLRRADGDEQVDHPDDTDPAAQDKDTPAVWLLKNQSEAAHLLLAVGNEVGLLGKKIVEQIGQLGQIVERRRFDNELIGHRRK